MECLTDLLQPLYPLPRAELLGCLWLLALPAACGAGNFKAQSLMSAFHVLHQALHWLELWALKACHPQA